jgi:putative peptidoglycan lipid II flippase
MSLGKNAGTVSLLSFCALLSGVVADSIIVAAFGLGMETDAFFIASLVPVAAITILHFQAGKVIQPVFIHALNTEGHDEAWRFLRLVITLSTVVVLGAGLLCLPGVSLWVKLQAPGASEGTRTMAAKLCLLFFLIPALYAPLIFMKEALIALGAFTAASSMKLIENLAKIALTLALVTRWGVFVLPVSMIVGALIQGVVLYGALRRKGFRYRPVFAWRDPKLVKAGHLVGFALVGHCSTVVAEVIQNVLASLFGPGTVSALRLATRIIDGFAGLLASGVVVAVMPMVAHSLSRNEPEQMKANIRDGFRLLLLVSLPASAWLLLMNKPLVALLFERMKFSGADTQVVSSLLLLMIPYILFSRLFGLAELAFYGSCDTKTPVIGIVGLAGFYIVAMLAMLTSLNVYALALARSLAYLFGTWLMFYLLQRRFGKFGWAAMGNEAMRIVLATTAMLGAIAAGQVLTNHISASGLMMKLIRLGLPSCLGAVALIISAVWLGLIKLPAIRGFFTPARVRDL